MATSTILFMVGAGVSFIFTMAGTIVQGKETKDTVEKTTKEYLSNNNKNK